MLYAAIFGGAGAVVVVAIAIALMAQRAISAEQRCADARVDATTKAGQIAIGAADLATMSNVAANEKARADALDDVLDQVATDGDAAGARSRVLSRWSRKAAPTGADPNAADGAGASALPHEAATGAASVAHDRDALIRPGD